MIQESDIPESKIDSRKRYSLIKTGLPSYYLLKLSKDPYETEKILSDDYKHESPRLRNVIEEHLEMYQISNDGDI